MIAAPQGFRRTLVLERSLPGRSSRDPGLTNCLRNRGKSLVILPAQVLHTPSVVCIVTLTGKYLNGRNCSAEADTQHRSLAAGSGRPGGAV